MSQQNENKTVRGREKERKKPQPLLPLVWTLERSDHQSSTGGCSGRQGQKLTGKWQLATYGGRLLEI